VPFLLNQQKQLPIHQLQNLIKTHLFKEDKLSQSSLFSIYESSNKVKQIAESLTLLQNKIHCKGLSGSAISIIIQSVFKKADKPFLLVFNEKEEAAYYLNDLEQMLGQNDVLFYPSSYRRPYQIEETDNANVLLRSEVLNRINSRKKPSIIVTYPEALFEKVVTKKELDKNTLKVAVGDNISIDFINEVLFEYEFKRVDFGSWRNCRCVFVFE
jgi:transcription-repair coupling factor (superfamily II helicase)